MAVTIVDRRTIVTEADTTTDWTGAGFGTTTSDVAEAGAAVAESLAIATGQTYYTQPSGSVDGSGGLLVYVYSFNNALQLAWDNSPPPNALLLGDGTNRIAFDMAGGNRRVFNHLEGPTNWQCLVLDTDEASTMNTAGNTYVVAGSFASLNLSAITQWGASFDTQSKALGGGYNVAVDIIRYGNDGIRITAGGSTTQGKFSEIATADRSTLNQTAHGVLRAYTTIAFGVQAPLTFGDDTTATTCYFEDSGVVVVYEDRNIADDKYYFNIEGHASATNSFVLTSSTITTAGPGVSVDASGGNINTLTLDTVSFVGLGQAVTFSSAADASGHSVNNCTFDGCGAIGIGDVEFLGNTIINSGQVTAGGGDMTGLTISGYEGTADTAALVFNETTDPDGELDGASFTKGTAATHAIELGANTPSSITLRDWTVSGYSTSNGQTDSVILNTSGKTITVNVLGATGTFSYKNSGAGSNTVLVLNPVTLAVTAQTQDGTKVQNARCFVLAGDTVGGVAYQDTVTITSTGGVATVTHTGHGFSEGQFVFIAGAAQSEYNGSREITGIDTVNQYTYDVSGSPVSPATGTIKATAVIIDSLTSAAGLASNTRSYSVNQDIDGTRSWVRKASAADSPKYKTSPIAGIINKDSGLSLTALMIPDE